MVLGIMFGTMEILIVAAIVLLLFGGRKIPEVMRGLGKGVREFRKAKSDLLDMDEPGDSRRD